ncbi:hypothetical protein [Limnohabitans sp.]|uniref:hypothetical protein n=1 Tax=Limnohabitans sp. TaxID=1907725 RepID=UPI0039BD7AFC|nr:hypothetical protein [Comamonadaceae bacterium]
MALLAKPELWRTEVGMGDAVAVLNIPGALQRARTFDIDVSLLVRVPEDHAQAWHALTLEIDGRRQWHRRIASSCPGQTDGLDYHCRVLLEAGPALRIRAVALTRGAVVQRLLIEAREDL